MVLRYKKIVKFIFKTFWIKLNIR